MLPGPSWQVCLRVRPGPEEDDVVGVSADGRISLDIPSQSSPTRPTGEVLFYDYDQMFDKRSRQEELYFSLNRPLVDFLFVGQSSTIMLYGQVRCRVIWPSPSNVLCCVLLLLVPVPVPVPTVPRRAACSPRCFVVACRRGSHRPRFRIYLRASRSYLPPSRIWEEHCASSRGNPPVCVLCLLPLACAAGGEN